MIYLLLLHLMIIRTRMLTEWWIHAIIFLYDQKWLKTCFWINICFLDWRKKIRNLVTAIHCKRESTREAKVGQNLKSHLAPRMILALSQPSTKAIFPNWWHSHYRPSPHNNTLKIFAVDFVTPTTNCNFIELVHERGIVFWYFLH